MVRQVHPSPSRYQISSRYLTTALLGNNMFTVVLKKLVSLPPPLLGPGDVVVVEGTRGDGEMLFGLRYEWICEGETEGGESGGAGDIVSG